MQLYNRIRANREHSESVYVRPFESSTKHRKSFSNKQSTAFCTACGTLFVFCFVVVYLFTATTQPAREQANTATLNTDNTANVNRENAATNPLVEVTAQPTTSFTIASTTVVPTTTTVTIEAAALLTDTKKEPTVAPTPDEPTLPPTTIPYLPEPISPRQYANIFDHEDKRTARPEPVFEDITRQYESGEYEPEEPERLPGLKITRRTCTPEDLLARYANTDYIYSFVNGSEVNHHFRKANLNSCHWKFRDLEKAVYNTGVIPPEMQLERNNNTPACYPTYLKHEMKEVTNVAGLLEILNKHIRPGIGDCETDELRHSIRSVEQHVRWHRGRVVIVSPGHHPTWVDGAKNFLAGACGDASVQALRMRGTHLRLTTVHQDAIMPYGIRLTVDSHNIEQHIWRVLNITAVHVYMNDDYFVNRDVAITDLFNEYGGTIVRTEKGILRNGVRGPESGGTWGEGVRNTHLFNIMELDMRHDDYLPADVESMWIAEKEEKQVNLSEAIPPISLNAIVDAAYNYKEPVWPPKARPRRFRRYATHAPFVYCTNMHRYAQTRYAREFAFNSLMHRGRVARDLYVPFLYNAFIMARPWVASPKFLPYLLQLHRAREQTPTEAPPSVEIVLDNFDGCAPATLRGGRNASECIFGKFLDNLTANEEMIERIQEVNPLYFNINAGFSTDAAANQLRTFLGEKFPTPIYLEGASTTTTADPEEAHEGGEEEKATTAAAIAVSDAVLTSTFDALMALPVVGVVSYEEGACPLVRSLSLAFAGHHRGRVHVAVQRHGDDGGEADETLREARNRLGNRVVSAMSAVMCTYNSQAAVGAAARVEGVADIARRVLQAGDGAGVELPSTCGDNGGAGLRVRGFVIDARTPSVPVPNVAALREALAMPGQTLALEDFRAVRVGPEERDVVLVLAREDAVAKAVHWITGASENDLFVTVPLPDKVYEELDTPLRWSQA